MPARWLSTLVLPTASALLLFAAGEPLAVGPLAWVALVPLLVAVLRADRARSAAAGGLVFGVVYFGVHLSWIFLFGWMAWTALTVVMALYYGAGLFAARLAASRAPRLAPLLVAGAWTGAELLRDRWPFGGYPWGAVGTTQAGVVGVRFIAGTIGVYGISFLVVLASAAIAFAIVERRAPIAALGLAAGVLVVFVAVDALAFGSPPEGTPVRVGVVQGNVPRPARVGQAQEIFDSHLALTRRLLDDEGRLDLVVWPESAIQGSDATEAVHAVRALASRSSTPFLVGRSFVEGDRYFNLQLHIDARGRQVGSYSKRHPVPFGEYVPIGFFRRFVGTLQSEIPVDQAPGTEVTVFDVEGTRVATPICFESVFPRDFLDFTRQGSELLVLSTNNASFEHSYAAQQHIAHTRMRALEVRQWVIQDALAGISGLLRPDGAIEHTTELFTADAFVADVRARPAHSLYAKTGDLFPAMWAGLAGAVGLLTLRTDRRRRQAIDSSSVSE